MSAAPSRTDSEELARAVARAAVQRILASGFDDAARAADPAPSSKPAPAPDRVPRGRGRPLVDVEALSAVPIGGELEVQPGALVTPLAREEAQRRGIRLSSRAVARAEAGRPGPVRSVPGSARAVAVGCDHGGFALKEDVLASLRELGARPVDFGTRDAGSVDYPDFAQAVAEAVASGQCELGVVIDGAGIGSAIAANKVPGVRAATCTDERMAANAREHNHANVLSIGAGWLTASQAHGILRVFLATEPGPDRHARRVRKIDAIEARYARGANGGLA